MRSPIEIRPFDPPSATREQWVPYHAYRRLRAAEEFPDLPLLPDAEFEQEACRHLPLVVQHRFIALRGGEIVGNMILVVRREGAPGYEEFAPYVDVFGGVPMRHRRQGIGRALLAHLHGFMVRHGQTTASIKVMFADGHAFMAAVGATRKLHGLENHLALAQVDWAQVQGWHARVATAALPLQWEVHAGRVPLDRLAQLIAPLSHLLNQVPLGELEVPPLRYELSAFESWYAELDRRGGAHYMVLLTHGDEVAAVCDANWDQRVPDRVHQNLTAVAPAWRGRGLAKAVKAAMLRLLHERRPELRIVTTFNAYSNAPMLAINRQLGFTLHREDCTYQIGREALACAAPAGPDVPSAEAGHR